MPSDDGPNQRLGWRRVIALAAIVPILAAAGVIALNLKSRGAGAFPELRLSTDEVEKSAARTQSMTVRPREGLGPLNFGMTPEEAMTVLGPPEHRRDEPSYHQTTLHYRRLGLHLTFETGGAELRAIICMSDARETLFSKSNKPAVTFGGSTAEGIRIGSSFDDVKKAYGKPTSSHQYFPHRRGQPVDPGDVVEHAYFRSLMVLEKDGTVVEMHIVLPGWTRNPNDVPEQIRIKAT